MYLIIIFYLVVILRIIVLMMDKDNYYNDLYDALNNKVLELGYAPRGRILDCNGKVLVDNKGIKVLVYNKLNSDLNELEISNILGRLVNYNYEISDDDLREYYYLSNKKLINNRVSDEVYSDYKNRKISDNDYLEYKYSLINDDEINSLDKDSVYFYKLMNKGFYYEDKILIKYISDELLVKINNLNIDGLRIDMIYERVYNYDTVLNPLFGEIGYIREEDLDHYLELGYEMNDIVGISFIEEYYEEFLKGSKSKYILSNGELIKVSDYVKGNDLVLGIDIDIQLGIEDILKKQILNAKDYKSSKYYNGSYIMLSDSDTGLIKSLVGITYQDGEFKSDVLSILTDSYTVGSVVKGASHYVSYSEGVLDSKTKLFDSCVKLKSQNEKCSYKSLGTLNDINALAYSSNYFQFINAIKVSGYKYTRNMEYTPKKAYFDMYREYFGLFGLGSKTGIDLDKEITGIKGDKVSGDLLLNYVIGQYDTYTLLQLNQYVSTIGNGGVRYKLRLGDYFINKNSEKIYENKLEVLNKVNSKYIDRIKLGFNSVIKYGTGVNYFDSKLGGGKTGTSETYINGISTTTKSFVGYFKINENNYALSIVSPNISYENSKDNYVYPINSRLSRQITHILFEN